VKQRLIRSVCEAAHDLSIKGVAEGIERLEELDATVEAGCHYFQGYLLGRPAREPSVGAWPRREA
jgi:EAL domain-containing protein (putative c-di-GMP-specific phosphodiesterase class I)